MFSIKSKISLGLVVCVLAHVPSVEAAIKMRIKDATYVSGQVDRELSGIGLVVGLAGDGDRNQNYTLQAFANMLQRNNINVPAASIQSKNIAIVEVQAKVPAYAKVGSLLDITVSSLGDAKSIHGGTLMRTVLFGPDVQTVYAVAQGPISVGGFSAGGGGPGGASIRRNHPVVGQRLRGARLTREVPPPEVVKEFNGRHYLELELRHPDITSAARIASAINQHFSESAYPQNASFVQVFIPSEFSLRTVDFLANIEPIIFSPDLAAKVLINEKTGTIVATSAVKISSCAISHGNLTINIANPLNVSQPGAFSEGQTAVTPSTDVTITEDGTSLVPLPDLPTIQEVSSSLNALGASSRDIIAIFQLMSQAGALQADIQYQ